MTTHLDNLEKILAFILRETPAQEMINILNEKIKVQVEIYMMMRDIENFIEYFKIVLSSSQIPKNLKFEPKLIRAFTKRTYTGFTIPTQDFRADRLYEYLKSKIGEGVDINLEHITLLEEEFRKLKKSSLEKIMEHARIATILKWLQGPLKNQLSLELQDYITFLATIYGQYRRNLVINIEWHPCEVSRKDLTTLTGEYRIFEIALMEALQAVRDSKTKNPDPQNYQEEFDIVLKSLENLNKMSEEGALDSFDSFKDKILVSTALIYIQDEFVTKDREFEKLIQLLVSLYYQFRDKYTAPRY
ncbi:MAG: hypothetical protein JSV97_09960 [candidate division WOR-3 bacterium]|nr:MAG: hypothetical protein JSV97_09960 [candidate division WOR-3 bacterium]